MRTVHFGLTVFVSKTEIATFRRRLASIGPPAMTQSTRLIREIARAEVLLLKHVLCLAVDKSRRLNHRFKIVLDYASALRP